MLAITGKKLSPEAAVTALDQYFVCTICQQVVDDPAECLECNDLCCSDCIGQWRARKDTCPSCRYEVEVIDIEAVFEE